MFISNIAVIDVIILRKGHSTLIAAFGGGTNLGTAWFDAVEFQHDHIRDAAWSRSGELSARNGHGDVSSNSVNPPQKQFAQSLDGAAATVCVHLHICIRNWAEWQRSLYK